MMENVKAIITVILTCLPFVSQAQSTELNCWTVKGDPFKLTVEETILKIPDTLAAVDLRGVEAITLDCSSANPNCLFYTNNATNVEGLPAANVVCDGVCDGLLLTDGACFYCPIAFTATDAMLRFTPRRDDGEEGDFSQPCHETVMVPFDADMVIPADANGPMSDGWLQVAVYSGYDSNSLFFSKADAGLLYANTPYIVRFAYAAYGTQILFCGQNKTGEKTTKVFVGDAPYFFAGITELKDVEPCFFLYHRGLEQFFAKAGVDKLMEPFRCFMVRDVNEEVPTDLSGEGTDRLTYYIIMESTATGVESYCNHSFSKQYYDLQGRPLINGKMGKGIHIIGGTKVIQ